MDNAFMSYHDKKRTFHLFCIIFFDFYSFTKKKNFSKDLYAYITRISFILKWMVQSFKSWMWVFAFKSKRTSLLLILRKTFAIIWPICISIWRSSEVLWFMRINTLGPIMFYIFLWTISSFVSINIKHILVKTISELL